MNQAFSSTLPVWPRSKSLFSALEARELIALSAPITGTAVINMGMSITAWHTDRLFLRGFKDTRITMVLTVTAKWAIGMPVAFFAGFHLGWSAGCV
jgi:hypothetical protein